MAARMYFSHIKLVELVLMHSSWRMYSSGDSCTFISSINLPFNMPSSTPRWQSTVGNMWYLLVSNRFDNTDAPLNTPVILIIGSFLAFSSAPKRRVEPMVSRKRELRRSWSKSSTSSIEANVKSPPSICENIPYPRAILRLQKRK